ncbi:SRPBCC domain-containing protein [Streptomyces sp. NPDC047022]|uniref:SRPBCC family protein n=1 Tax=Streptomyces sp. NPDC047022 TaxID=3155737 RepID=UPI0033D34331
MSEIAFQVDVDAERAAVHEALNTHDGLTGWWTTGVNRKDDTLFFDFPQIPEPFRLRRDRADEDEVRWTSVGAFPPHWSGTVITWQLTDIPGTSGTRVLFRHTGWQDGDPGLPPAAYTWGQLMTRLKQYAETATPQPLFTL